MPILKTDPDELTESWSSSLHMLSTPMNFLYIVYWGKDCSGMRAAEC